MRQTGRQTRRPERRTPQTAAELAKVHERALAEAAARSAARDAAPDDDQSRLEPRPEIGDSWARLRRLGLDPDSGAAAVHLGPAEIEHRRRTSGLDPVLPVLRDTLLEPVGQAPLILAIADADGHILWQEGERGLRRSADRIGFLTGARWVEESVGTNGIAAALRAQRPMHVHSAEHYLRSHHSWTCVAAPVHDPGTGRLIGAINLSGPAHTVRPYLLQLTATAARLAETELRARRLESLHHLRTLAAPLLARVNGPALVVDAAGWTAAAAGFPPPARLRLPAGGWGSAAVHWLPSLGECVIEPLADGWLVRPVRPQDDDPTATGGPDGRPDQGLLAEQAEGARLRLDLRRPDRAELSVHGAAGSWSHGLSPRHAELLLLLATERDGHTAAQLADGLFGDPARTVTVRAELSRLRRYLGGLLAHRPYRFAESVLVSVLGPEDPYDLLPSSSAPAVRRLRTGLADGTARLPGPPPLPGPRGPGDAAAPRALPAHPSRPRAPHAHHRNAQPVSGQPVSVQIVSVQPASAQPVGTQPVRSQLPGAHLPPPSPTGPQPSRAQPPGPRPVRPQPPVSSSDSWASVGP
ncbi:GAF domain-containing protein [Streptomyces sp. BE20]|uniref:GAF domain-containing protein n=1 Tax=Streptomyces sp. BE20 TaxID=3002525 RepID=UPI002E7A509B|nr:GAF domain-containing protein [Streptomyces sp. BE20]MEE1821732.1 GAF domain-containing protein [Streptomyces sp. BE20]